MVAQLTFLHMPVRCRVEVLNVDNDEFEEDVSHGLVRWCFLLSQLLTKLVGVLPVGPLVGD